ncbi:MAG: peroxide stress protein YaaA, partial [Rhodothermales bacterium]|nr:peroxide stress protein YaaA [Rhodothermales bacterium]
LLSPSAEKISGGNPFAPDMFDYRSSNTFNYFHELNPERRQLINTLQDAIESDEDLDSLFGLESEALEHAIQSNLALFDAPLMSALDRYSPGVLYTSMNFQTLPTGAQRRLLENGIIFSGLFGLLRPDDLIPEYYLDMNAALPEVPSIKEFWRRPASELLNERVSGKVVWNLLPDHLEDTWEDEHTYAEMIRVRFARDRRGQRTFQDQEALAGQFINLVVREAAEDLELIRTWVHPEGYKFHADSEQFDEETRVRQIVFAKRS